MPIPIFIAIGIGVVAFLGVGSGAVGTRRNLEARRIKKQMSARWQKAADRHTAAEDACIAAADALGRRKAVVMSGEMRDLHTQLARYRGFDFAADFADELAPDNLGLDFTALDEIDFKLWNKVAVVSAGALKVAGGAGSSSIVVTSAGTVLVYSGASTAGGTAISGLSGAALTNATLAWFGGGSIAAGGGGVAAGALVLSGVAAAPAALVGGVALFHLGTKNLKQAKANEIEVTNAIARANADIALLKQMISRAGKYEQLLAELQKEIGEITSVVRGIADQEDNAQNLSEEQLGHVRRALELFSVTKSLVDVALMHDGELTVLSEELLAEGIGVLARAR